MPSRSLLGKTQSHVAYWIGRIPGTRWLMTSDERRGRRRIIQHYPGRHRVSTKSVLVAEKAPTSEDVAIAGRLLRAFRAGYGSRSTAGRESPDLWTIINSQQGHFASILHEGNEEDLAAYLCNVARYDAAIGIIQGDREYERIKRDRPYRDYLSLMVKDKIVSLAEALGCLPVENPEGGPTGVSLHMDIDDLLARISRRLGVDIVPPDVDGGLLKLRTNAGFFCERDVNAIFTASLLNRILEKYEAAQICEIGGGSGRVAYWSWRLGLNSYTIVDLPHINVVQGYYLLKSLPADHVTLYGENPDQAGAGLVIWPNHAINELQGPRYRLVLNQDSMPEMSLPVVEDYLRWIRLRCQDLFVSINHESKASYDTDLRHVSVPEAVAAISGFELQDRYPYWLRSGYVVELYRMA
jgi:hypothetical protein